MATTRKRQTTSGAAAKKVAAPEAAPAAETVVEAPAPVVEAPVEAPAAEDRAAMLALFTQPQEAPQEAAKPAPAPEVELSGVEATWTEQGGERALVIVDLFKAVIGAKTMFGYKGTIITAPAETIERGIRFGALSKEF